jgi:GAF domain-containing protein
VSNRREWDAAPTDGPSSEAEKLHKRERAMRRAYEVIADPELTFSEQIDALLNVVRDAIDVDYATLSKADSTADRYIFEAVAVPDDADLRAGDSAPLQTTNCERVVETQQTLVLNDVAVDAPGLADRAGNAEWGISCYLGAPVSVDGDVRGTFCFYEMEARSEDFSDWEVTFVELLSDWVGSELERRRQRDRLEAFAGMLAHELRNPLSVAKIYQRQAAEGDEAAAEQVATALDRIEELIDIILVTACGEDSSIDWESVAVADAATEAWTDATDDDEADLVVETERIVEADSIHFHHLLENLFANAVEHGAPDVTVRIGDLANGFYVEDDGSGIAVEERGSVFEAGYTTEDSGMGLGLTFVTQLADAYGWECHVTESESGGARFEFTGVEIVSESDE